MRFPIFCFLVVWPVMTDTLKYQIPWGGRGGINPLTFSKWHPCLWLLTVLPPINFPVRGLSILHIFHAGMWHPHRLQQHIMFPACHPFQYQQCSQLFHFQFIWKPVFYSIETACIFSLHHWNFQFQSRDCCGNELQAHLICSLLLWLLSLAFKCG